jgi:hypothetical protein
LIAITQARLDSSLKDLIRTKISRCPESFLQVELPVNTGQRTKKILQAILKNIGLISVFAAYHLTFRRQPPGGITWIVFSIGCTQY